MPLRHLIILITNGHRKIAKSNFVPVRSSALRYRKRPDFHEICPVVRGQAAQTCGLRQAKPDNRVPTTRRKPDCEDPNKPSLHDVCRTGKPSEDGCKNFSLTETRLPARSGGARRNRTDDLLNANQALSQLSYGPDLARHAPCLPFLQPLAAARMDTAIWWAWIDSNYRPHPYQGCALTT